MILNKRRALKPSLLATMILIALLIVPQMLATGSSTPSQGVDSLSNHWLSGQGCFRDELNQSDIDYYNCWLDNTGKILTSSEITSDALDASNALLTLTRYGLSTTNEYLPETVVNSTMDISSNGIVTNRIAMLTGSNQSSKLEQLALGNYYAGEQILAYLGSDRILVDGTIYRSSNSTIFQTARGFVKRSLFSTPVGQYYLYLNTTLSPGNTYARVSMQVQPLNSTITSNDLLYLQVFSSTGQFNNASLYDSKGNYERPLTYDNGSPASPNGTIIAYSNQQSVFTEDSVAISFNSSNAQINDFEHWYRDGAFDSLSWVGIAFNSPPVATGRISSPIFARVYPIEHLDYHLINDTARYIAENLKDTAVSPPVGFGFIAYGLALASSDQPANQTLATLARSYWNYYYSRYASSSNYGTPYARSINTLALTGFKLYGCNYTVEHFTRNFLGNSSGASIEEDGWGAAALYQLQSCTGLPGDIALYKSFVHSFTINSIYFAGVLPPGSRSTSTVVPGFTFQYAEAASALMLGGVSYNNPVVLSLMSAVFQSNVSGTILNQPYRGDLANTETLPAYLLSTWLFENDMQSSTGYSITGLTRANITSIDYSRGALLIGAIGNNGSISLSSGNSMRLTFQVDGRVVVPVTTPVSTIFLTSTSIVTTTAIHSRTVTETSTTTNTTTVTISHSTLSQWDLPLIVIGTILALVGVTASGFALRRVNRP